MFPTMWSSLDANKKPTQEELKKIQPFMFCKWLAGDSRTLQSANLLNYYYNIPVESQFLFIQKQFAGKIRNIKYIKSEKDNLNTNDIDIICKFYKVSEEKSKMYLEFISESELKYLRDLYECKKS